MKKQGLSAAKGDPVLLYLTLPVRKFPPTPRATFHSLVHLSLAKPHTILRGSLGILYTNLKKRKCYVLGAGDMAWLVR